MTLLVKEGANNPLIRKWILTINLMKTEDEIKEYLKTHFFVNRVHAHAVRAVLRDKFKTAEFEFKITSSVQIEYEDISNSIITVGEAIDYIWG